MKGVIPSTRKVDPPVAIIRAELEHSFTKWDVEYLNESRSINAILARPEWCPVQWIVPEGPLTLQDPRVTALLFTKVRLVADAAYASTVNDENPSVAESDLEQQHIALRTAEHLGATISPIRVEARLWGNGEVDMELAFDRTSSVVASRDPEVIETFARHSLRRELRTQVATLRGVATT